MSKQVRYGIAAGIVGALIFVSAGLIPGATSFLFILPLPFYMVGFAFGFSASLVSSLTGAAVISVLFLELVSGIVFLVLFSAPIVMSVYLTHLRRPVENQDGTIQHEWYPVGHILAWLAIWGCSLFLFAYLASLGIEGGIKQVFSQGVREFLAANPAFEENFRSANADIDFNEMIELISLAAPAMVSVSLMSLLILNYMAARLLTDKLNMSIRETFGLKQAEPPELLALAFIACLALTLLGGELGFIGASLAAILFLPYIFVGLAVVHAISEGIPGRGMILFVFYAILLFATPVIVLLGVLGLAEQWLGLRKKANLTAT